MECPICGIDNEPSVKVCYICDTELPDSKEVKKTISEEKIIETVDVSKFAIRWKNVFYVVVLVILFAAPWFLISDLYFVPKDVVASVNNYKYLKNNYLAEKQFWKGKNKLLSSVMKKYDSLAFEKISPEIFMASMDGLISRDVSLFPKGKGDFLLVKKEHNFLPVLVSLELQVNFDKGVASVSPKKILRGSREIPIALSWHYFGPELDILERSIPNLPLKQMAL